MPACSTKTASVFSHPDNWQLTREESATGWTVTVQSPDTAILSCLTYEATCRKSARWRRPCLHALRAGISGPGSGGNLESLAGAARAGQQIRFFSLDLTNTCCTLFLP